MIEEHKREPDWVNIAFLTLTPLVAVVGLAWYVTHIGFFWADVALFVAMYMATGISITAGYHRYFSHQTYEAHWSVKLFYLLFGAAAVENSALSWSSDHRYHHRFVDTEQDPYDIMKGIFWAHMGWVFFKTHPVRTYSNAPDLKADPMVMWQHRWYLPLTIGLSFGLPILVGLVTGRVGGALLWGAFLRVVAVQHGTFFINSAAHYIGRRTYSNKDTSRDNPYLALFTFGEGYHNFHHTFQHDYRNGIRWYHWDPSKWLIGGLSMLGLTWKLNKVTDYAITRARMEMDQARVRARLERQPDEWRDALWARYQAGRERLEGALLRAIAMRRRYQEWAKTAPQVAADARLHLAQTWARRIRRARKAVLLARTRYAERLREVTRVPATSGTGA
jgi:stearoyl-CoA desaturase (delta-9 desaturase)